MSNYKVGISIGSTMDDTKMSITGVPQNIVFLYELLNLLGHNVTLLTDTAISVGTIKLAPGRLYNICSINDVTGSASLDIFLEMGQIFTSSARQILNSTGCKIVSVRCGNALIIDMEDLFTKSAIIEGKQHIRDYIDHVWILPHHVHQSSYLASLLDAKASVMPYIWEPFFIEDDKFNSKVFRDKLNIYVMEPNFSVLKNALIPMVIINNQFKIDPDSFGQAFIVNGDKLPTNNYFINNITANLDSLNSYIAPDKVFFTPRCQFQEAFVQPDVLLSHHWFNGLNNLSFEALYLGVAFVHNSEFFKELGYFYPGFDTYLGQSALNDALNNHKKNFTSHLTKNHALLKKYSIFDESVQNKYSELLQLAIDT
ncbi:MAG: DUF2827 family protein [Cycloclasticus sp.]